MGRLLIHRNTIARSGPHESKWMDKVTPKGMPYLHLGLYNAIEV